MSDKKRRNVYSKRQKNYQTIFWYVLGSFISLTLIVLCHFEIPCLLFGDAFGRVLDEFLSEILLVLLALFIEKIIVHAFEGRSMRKEESNKINEDFGNSYSKHKKTLKIGGKEIPIWYSYDFLYDKENKYKFIDDPSDENKYELPRLLRENFFKIMEAHVGSDFKNPKMIRLSDINVDNKNITFYTNRTTFYNDLVTNRVMDYEISQGVTVRNLYERNDVISSYKESRMSNHIGVNAIVFYGNKLIIAVRDKKATFSKNCFTSTFAFGVNENDFEDAKSKNEIENNAEEFLKNLVRNKLADTFYNHDIKKVIESENDYKLKIYFLGSGQMINMGGKPHLYYAIFIDKDDKNFIRNIDPEKNSLNDNTEEFIYADSFAVNNAEKRKLAATYLATNGKTKTIIKKAESSMLANIYQLKRPSNIDIENLNIINSIEIVQDNQYEGEQ